MRNGLGSLPSVNDNEKRFQKMKFRSTFEFSSRIFWFPSHQTKALRQLQNGLHQIDFVIEVRDSRIPLLNTNLSLNRPRLIIYNKADLVPRKQLGIVVDHLRNRGESVMITNCLQKKGISKIIGHCAKICETDPIRYPYLSVIVLGAPNVGKSTLINALRNTGLGKGKATQQGPKAGVTTRIQTRIKINQDPPVYLHDTPGIFNPFVKSVEQGFKIALVGGTNDSLTTVINIADYLLFKLNNSNQKHYWYRKLGLESGIDDIYRVLEHICISKNFVDGKKRFAKLLGKEVDWDYDEGAAYFVELYRNGSLGKFILDEITPENLELMES